MPEATPGSVDLKSPGLEDLPTPVDSSAAWADQVEIEEAGGAPEVPVASRGGVVTTWNGDEKTEIEFRTNPDTMKREKVVTTYKVERKMVLKSVAARKRLPKFGASKGDGPGLNKATTTVSHDEVNMKFISTHDSAAQDEADDMRKLQIGDKLIACRHCGSTTHLTAHCSLKSQMEQYKALESEMQGKPRMESLGPVAPGSYVPPSLRNRAAGSAPGPGLRSERSDQNCVRVSNLPDSITDDDLKDLFKPFGPIERIFLAKDKVTKQSKGFAFVTYRDRRSAENAIARVDRHGYDHLILSVEWAQPVARP